MPLKRTALQRFESDNFLMHTRTIDADKHWCYQVEALTPLGREMLSRAIGPIPVLQARAYIATLEQALRQRQRDTRQRRQYADVVDATTLAAFLDDVYPGEPPMAAQAKLADYLGMSCGHIRHMVSGNKLVCQRTTRLLRGYASLLGERTRRTLAKEQHTLNPIVQLYEALSSEESPMRTINQQGAPHAQ